MTQASNGLSACGELVTAAELDLSDTQVAAFCERWGVTEFALFGSVLHDNFGPHSDLDVLVRFRAGSHPSLFGLSRMETELSALVGRRVDVVEREAVEQSSNYIRRDTILGSARTIYASDAA